jgi:membrane protein implicated in regulation of membrane protease activity
LLAAKSNVRLFRTAGWALLAGNVLAIILACITTLLFFAASLSAIAVLTVPIAGTTLSCLAWIIAAKAFFAVKAPTQQLTSTRQVKYCSQRGAENLPDAVFCARCGKSL